MASCKTLGYVHSLESFGSVDGPGVRFVVFLQGVPCGASTATTPKHGQGRRGVDGRSAVPAGIPLPQLLGQKGGITVSGGEPLRQLDFLTEFFTLARAKGVHGAGHRRAAFPPG